MAERFSNTNNTAPVISTMKNKRLPVPHSFFDLTRNIAFDCPIGAIIPFDIIETLPDSDYEISYDILALTKNPLVRRLLSGMSVYIHTYGEDCKDMWEGFPTFVSRGRSGKITRKIPETVNCFKETEGAFYNVSHQFSPSSYLGVPPAHRLTEYVISDNEILHYYDNNENVQTVRFNALPLVMYQQICIHNYLPSNLLQDNAQFFPEDEMHLRLSPTCGQSDGATVFNLSYDDEIAEEPPYYVEMDDITISRSTTPVILDQLRVRQFQGDRFNTGLPFPELVRGDVPSIPIVDNVTLSGSPLSVEIPAGQTVQDSVALYAPIFHSPGGGALPRIMYSPLMGDTEYINGLYDHVNINPRFVGDNGSSTGGTVAELLTVGDNSDVALGSLPGLTNKTLSGVTSAPTVTGSFQSSITLSQLNALKVLTLMRQRAALTDGSYNELIKAQYNTSPDLHVGKPYYIGGTKQPLVFSEVVQTSESSDDSPLGRTGSRGVTAGNGYIGKYHSKDFGYIMSVLSIVPDVYYTQGLEKLWTRVNHDDFHFPLMDSLAPMPILNKELFVSGDSSVDDDVFAYQERDSEYKSRQNVVRGNLQFDHEVDEEDSAYTMKRHFTETPTLSYGFTGMFPTNIDYSVFSNSIDAPFVFSITSRVRATLPLPYVTMPNDGLTKI